MFEEFHEKVKRVAKSPQRRVAPVKNRFGLMGTEMTKKAKSAIQCPNNLIQTFDDHGLGYSLNV
jgi:hypothetical protein